MPGDSSIIRRIGIFAIALMIVSSMVAPTALASQNTQAPEDDCKPTLLEVIIPALSDQAECEAQQMVANATWADTYASALSQNDLQASSATTVSNHLEDSKTYARTIAKTEAVKLFNNDSNGLTKAEIKTKVNGSIEDYYGTMQTNLLQSFESQTAQTYYVYNASEASGVDYTSRAFTKAFNAPAQDLSQANITTTNNWMADGQDAHTDPYANYYIGDTTVTLTNGSSVNSTMLVQEIDSTTKVTLNISEPMLDGTDPYQMAFYILDPAYAGTISTSGTPDAKNYNESNSIEMFDPSHYALVWDNIGTTSENAETEAAAFVDLLFNNYNRSDGVDITEVLNPNDLATQWNSNYNTTGYYGWKAATLGLTGLEGDVNASFSLNYTPAVNHTDTGNYTLNGTGDTNYAFVSSQTYNLSGTLMTDWDPNPNQNYTYQRGETYNTANASAPVLFIEQVNSTQSRVVRLNGTFTIDELTNVQTGETINSTSLQEQNHQTWSANSSVEEIRDLVEYRDKAVTSNEAGGGGINTGGLFGDVNFGTTGIILIALAGGALLILTRS